MPIPDFQSTMLPLLRFLGDGKLRSNQEIYEALEGQFSLTDEEKRQLLPSGKQRVFINRVAWAKSHLKQAGLLDSPRRGYYRITERGRTLLESNPRSIDCRRLQEFPEYVDFRTGKKTPHESEPQDVCSEEQTPEEIIELGFKKINHNLAQELLSSIKGCSSRFFERLVIDLLLAMGYGGSRQEAGKLTGEGSDEGIDGIINEDKLGLDVIYVQAKRWENGVSRPEIQKFAGALQGKRAKKGVYITTSSFTPGAIDFAKSIDSKIILIDGERLTELMIEHGVGVSIVQTYHLKKVDADYFLEE